MTAHEESILPPIDPSISDENDWWEFHLTDVKVLRPGKMLYANLLEATEEHPVQVIGCLELQPNQEHLGESHCKHYALHTTTLSFRLHSLSQCSTLTPSQNESLSTMLLVTRMAKRRIVVLSSG